MKRPLVAVVVAYGLGLLLAQWLRPPLTALAGLLTLGVILTFAFKKHRAWLIWVVVALVAATNFAVRTSWVTPDDLRVLAGNEPAMVTVRGTLAEAPRLKLRKSDKGETWRSMVRVKVSELSADGTRFRPTTGEALATVPGILGPEYFWGQRVEIKAVISSPPGPLAEGLFDYQEYLRVRGIYYCLATANRDDWQLREPHLARPPLTGRFLNWAQQTLAQGLPEEDEPLRLLWAMTLGWRTAFTGDVGEPFLEAGTMHLFAIDGLRIALLSGMIVTLLRIARLSRAWCGLVAVPVIWFYTAATGWEPSAVRASVMMTVVLGGWMLKRPYDLPNALAVAAFIILLLDPRQGWEAGFQLSFFVMLVIAVMLPRLNAFSEKQITRLIKPDPFLPEEWMPAWREKLLPYARRFGQMCGISFAAWIGSLPLAAKYFHLFSPVSTLANLPAVPVGALALTANLGSLLCGQWLPWITVLFNHAAWTLMRFLHWLSVEFAALPGAYVWVPGPSPATICIYYAAVLAPFSGWFKTARRIVAGLAVLAIIAGVYFWQWETSRDETAVTVLPLNGGHAVYVDADGRRNDWLIDCGGKDAADSTLKDFLRAQGVNRLPRLVLTAASARECGGAKLLDEHFNLGELWTSGATFRSPEYRAVTAYFETNGLAHKGGTPPSRHHVFNAGETNGCWQVLFPGASVNAARAGDAALVLRGNFDGTRVLLLSDLSRSGQSELLAQANDLSADIVVAGLPNEGEGEPLCNALIAAVRPKVIVIVDSEFSGSLRVSPALRGRLKAAGIPVIYTKTAGAVKIVADKTGWKLHTMDGEEFENASGALEHRSPDPARTTAF